MKNYILTVLLLVLLGELVYLYLYNSRVPKTEVLAVKIESPLATVTSSPTVQPTGTPIPAPTISPTLKPTLRPTPTPVPQPAFTSQEINGFIERFSGQYGIDANVVRHLALCESGFNASAVSLSYAGLFQFGPVTWKNIRLKMGESPNLELRFNAEEAVQTAAYAISQAKGKLWPNCMP